MKNIRLQKALYIFITGSVLAPLLAWVWFGWKAAVIVFLITTAASVSDSLKADA
jgi:hypothetical protein